MASMGARYQCIVLTQDKATWRLLTAEGDELGRSALEFGDVFECLHRIALFKLTVARAEMRLEGPQWVLSVDGHDRAMGTVSGTESPADDALLDAVAEFRLAARSANVDPDMVGFDSETSGAQGPRRRRESPAR